MGTDKAKLSKGLSLMAWGGPFIIAAPVLFTKASGPDPRYWMMAIAAVCAAAAFYFFIRGLNTVLSAFFDPDQED
jgi:hypothetical protein